MNKLAQDLKIALVRAMLNTKQDSLDKHYMTTSKGSFTRRELASEVENETEIGLQQMESMLKLTIHLLEKQKENI